METGVFLVVDVVVSIDSELTEETSVQLYWKWLLNLFAIKPHNYFLFTFTTVLTLSTCCILMRCASGLRLPNCFLVGYNSFETHSIYSTADNKWRAKYMGALFQENLSPHFWIQKRILRFLHESWIHKTHTPNVFSMQQWYTIVTVHDRLLAPSSSPRGSRKTANRQMNAPFYSITIWAQKIPLQVIHL